MARIRSLLFCILLVPGLSVNATVPSAEDLFVFSQNWNALGYGASDLIQLMSGITPTPTPTFTLGQTPTLTHTASLLMTHTPTWTPTSSPTVGTPHILDISPSVVDVGDIVTLTVDQVTSATVTVDVGNTLLVANGNGNQVQFQMPAVKGMVHCVHCVEVRIVTPFHQTSNAVGLVYPRIYHQPNDIEAHVESMSYNPGTRRFSLSVAIENNQTAQLEGGAMYPISLSSPVAIIYDATGVPSIGTGIGTDNDDRNQFISANPHWDYRTVEPAKSSVGFKLPSGQKSAARIWTMAADQPVTKAFSLAIYLTSLAKAPQAQSNDVASTAFIPRPYGLAYDPTTNYLHVSQDGEGMVYGIDLSTVDSKVGLIVRPEEGPSYMEVSPSGQDPMIPGGRLWWSWTLPDQSKTFNVVGAFDATFFIPNSTISNLEYSYDVLPTGINYGTPKGLAWDPVISKLYIASPTQVVSVSIGSSPSGSIIPLNFIQAEGLGVDPGNGDLYIVDKGDDTVTRIRNLRSGPNVTYITFGETGSEPGYFNDPRGIDVDSEGVVFVADRGNHRVQAFYGRSTGAPQWLMSLGGYVSAASIIGCTGPNSICPRPPLDGFDYPCDVEVIDANTVWVSDFNNLRVVKWEHDSFSSNVWPSDKSYRKPGIHKNLLDQLEEKHVLQNEVPVFNKFGGKSVGHLIPFTPGFSYKP